MNIDIYHPRVVRLMAATPGLGGMQAVNTIRNRVRAESSDSRFPNIRSFT